MEIVIPYTPRPLQLILHSSTARFVVIVCHRRFGKTVCAINELLKKALNCTKPNARFGYIAPTYKQAKDIAWDYLKRFALVIPMAVANEAELRIDLPNGARIRLYGADNPDSLRGIYLDGVVIDEPADINPRLWTEIIRPLLADRGGWAWFIGTPKGHNLLFDLWNDSVSKEGWQRFMFKASETKILPENELEQIKLEIGNDIYNQEFECDFDIGIKGAYYADFIRHLEKVGQITGLSYEPRLKVDTWWDLGINDSTTIWFTQSYGNEIRFIDYYENSGEGLQHYASVLDKKGYVYDTHNAPHDIAVRELGSGQSRIETAEKLGIKFEVVPNIAIVDGIQAARNILPRCWFDAKKCEQGLKALRQYRKEFDEKRGVFKSQPLHDWSSHAADSFRYCAVGLKDKRQAAKTQIIRPKTDWNALS